MHTGSLFDLSVEEMIEELKKRENDIKKMDKKSNKIQKTKKNSKSNFKFYKLKMESCYQTYRTYLEARCEALPGQLEKRFPDCEAQHIASRCRGMSNYIEIENGSNAITIRISDHNPTGSGSPCDHYIYIQDKTWMEIKKEIFRITEDFLKQKLD